METNNRISYTLFRIGIFSILFYAILSCRTIKEKTTQQAYEREEAYTHRQHTYTEAFGWVDSTWRYWSFRTDSAFHYHPDSGIYAKQGLLSLWENKLQKQTWTATTNSNNTEAEIQEQYGLWKTYYRDIKDSKWMVLIVILLILTVCYFLYIRWPTFGKQ